MNRGEYIARYRPMIVLITVAFALVGVVLGGRIPDRYESTAQIVLRPVALGEPWRGLGEGIDTDAFTANVELDLETETTLARSTAVEGIVVDQLRAPEVSLGLRSGLSVSTGDETNVMSITYAHADPSVAVDRAQAFARAYLEFRERALADAALDQAAELGRKLRAVRDQIELATRRFSVSLDDGRTTALDAYLASLRSAATEIQFELAALARLPVVGQIIQPASRATPSGPDRAVAGGAGLLVGLVLGLGYAGLRARRDDRIASVADLEATVGAPVLGRVPSSRMIGMRERRIDAPRVSQKTIEAYRIVRANLAAAARARGARSIVVTSASSGRGTATASVNLAVALTQAGNRIALIGSDTRSSRLSNMLGLPTTPGLTDVLTGRLSLAQAIVPLSARGLRRDSFVLPPGTPVEDPAAILGSDSMARLLDELVVQGIDLVLISAPAILTIADAAALAHVSDAVLLVVDPTHDTHASLEAVRGRLEQVRGDVLGAVVTRSSLPDSLG